MARLVRHVRARGARRNPPPTEPPLDLPPAERPVDIRSLNGHTSGVTRVIGVPEGSLIATVCDDGHLRVFELDGDGEPLHDLEAHPTGVKSLAALGGDVIASGGDDGKVVTWRASSGECLDDVQVVGDGDAVDAIAATGESGLAVGTARGVLVFFSHCFGRDLREAGREDSAHNEWIYDIAVRGDVLVTASADRTAAVWSAAEHTQSAVLRGHKGSVFCAAVSERYVATGSDDKTIRLYVNGEGYARDRVLEGFHANWVWMVALVGEDLLISASRDETIVFTSLSTGKCVARAGDFGIHISSASITPDGRFACGGVPSKAAILSPPTLVANALKEHAALLSPPSQSLATTGGPLQNALINVTAGRRGADDACRELVTKENCSLSVEEWWCAHRLLMAAKSSGGIPGDLHFEGSRYHWFLNLYTPSRCLELGPDDWDIVMQCVTEAKDAGVISEPEAVLAAILGGQDLKQEVSRLQNAGRNMLSLLSQLLVRQAAADEKMRRLGEKLNTMERVQKWNALLTAVFSFAPLGGAAAANAITALAGAVPLLECMLSTGAGVQGAVSPLILDKFIRCTGVLITPDVWEKLPPGNQVTLKVAVEALGMSWEDFCAMIERAAVQRAVNVEPDKKLSGVTGDDNCSVLVADVADGAEGADVSSAFNDESGARDANPGATSGMPSDSDAGIDWIPSIVQEGDDDMVFDLQELKAASANSDALKFMTSDSLSKVVAAIMISFEEDLRSLVPVLAMCLRNVFRKKSIGGDVLVGFLEKELILKMIVDALREEAVYVDFGPDERIIYEWRLREFLLSLLCSNCDKRITI